METPNIEGGKIKTNTKIEGVKSKQITWVSLHNALTKAGHNALTKKRESKQNALTEGRKSKRYLTLDYLNILCYKKNQRAFPDYFINPKNRNWPKMKHVVESSTVDTYSQSYTILGFKMLLCFNPTIWKILRQSWSICDHRISRSKQPHY